LDTVSISFSPSTTFRSSCLIKAPSWAIAGNFFNPTRVVHHVRPQYSHMNIFQKTYIYHLRTCTSCERFWIIASNTNASLRAHNPHFSPH
jgi:hypothetical protein